MEGIGGAIDKTDLFLALAGKTSPVVVELYLQCMVNFFY